MTPCESCPFAGCRGCAWSGGGQNGTQSPAEAISTPPEGDRTNHHKRGAERGKK